MKTWLNIKSWVDAFCVIGIAFIPAAMAYLFDNYLPVIVVQIINHHASTIGYLFICINANMIDIKHLSSVVVAVRLIMMPVYTIVFWDKLGTKYTMKGIIFNGFIDEIISVAVGCIIFVTLRDLKDYFKCNQKNASIRK